MNLSKLRKGKLFLTAVVVVLAVIGGFSVYKKFSGGKVALEINTPEENIRVTEPFDLNVSFENNSNNDLRNVRFVIQLPDEIIIPGDRGQKSITRELGDVSAGGTHDETFRVIALPSDGADYKVKVNAFYSPSSIVAEFKKSEEKEINVEGIDFRPVVEVPETVFPGEEFETVINFEKINWDALGAELFIEEPKDFEFINSDPKPSVEGKNGWKISDFSEGDKIVVHGKVNSSGSDNFDIGVRVVVKILGEEYSFVADSKNVSLEPSPLSFEIRIAERGESVNPGDNLEYILSYRNNTDVDLQDVAIKAQLIGDMFNISSLKTSGNFKSFNNTITWNSGNSASLRRIPSGAGGDVSFSINVENGFGIERLNDKDFTLIVDGTIESPTVPYLVNADRTLNSARIETKVSGRLFINMLGYFRDASLGVINSGPFPPRVGVPTNFTVHWLVTNFATDVDEIEVRARLENGVSFTGVVSGNTDTLPQFDSGTREVVWKVGKLLATTGILSEKPEAIFQIQAVPAQSNISSYMPLVGRVTIKGRDEFTDSLISSADNVLTTQLQDDPTVKTGDGLVEQ